MLIKLNKIVFLLNIEAYLPIYKYMYMIDVNDTGIFRFFSRMLFAKEQVEEVYMEKNKQKVSCMELEIKEQPAVIEALVNKYITDDNYILVNIPFKVKKVVLIASGSSYHCSLLAGELMKNISCCDGEAFYASEFDIKQFGNVEDDTLFVFVSQSGETGDTLKAMRDVLKVSKNVLCITNNEGSTMWELANYKLLTCAGKENSIASTKAMTAQLLCLYFMILKIMHSKKVNVTQEINDVKKLGKFLKLLFEKKSYIKKVAAQLAKYQTIEILGSHEFYSVAKEGALKIKETSYINTTAYPQGEFMHGHVAILNNKSAIISLIDSENPNVAISNIEKMKNDYSPCIVTISDIKDSEELEKHTNYNIKIDSQTVIFKLFASIVIMQLLALEIAKKLKRNIDRPQGLKKVVMG